MQPSDRNDAEQEYPVLEQRMRYRFGQPPVHVYTTTGSIEQRWMRHYPGCKEQVHLDTWVSFLGVTKALSNSELNLLEVNYAESEHSSDKVVSRKVSCTVTFSFNGQFEPILESVQPVSRMGIASKVYVNENSYTIPSSR